MSQKRFCNYCKGSGHLIAECKRRPQNLPHSTDAGSSLMASTPQSIVPVPPVVSSTTGSEFLKLSDAQALIQNALAGLGISGNKSSSSSCRYLILVQLITWQKTPNIFPLLNRMLETLLFILQMVTISPFLVLVTYIFLLILL